MIGHIFQSLLCFDCHQSINIRALYILPFHVLSGRCCHGKHTEINTFFFALPTRFSILSKVLTIYKKCN